MRWPKQPVNSVHPSRFHPPFCPWPLCRAHLGRGKGFHRHGFYRTQRGRHAILFHRRCLESLPGITEAVVHDHFETFIGRQDHALGVGTAVGSKSWFVYDLDPAPHRGSGRQPDRQAAELLVPNRPYVASIRRSFSALLSKIAAPDGLCSIVDGRVDYRAAVMRLALRDRVALRVCPNPKRGPKGTPRSPEAIERDQAMFPADQLHQLIRQLYEKRWTPRMPAFERKHAA